MKELRVRFPCGELSLEGIVGIPEGSGPFPAVIICHPHPLLGGSMDNNVVNSVFEFISRAWLIPFKFNFRGVGGSEGEFGEGIGEQDDVAAAISFVSSVKEVDSGRVGLVGYSAGAGFGLPAGYKDERIKALAVVSPPLSMFDFGFLKDCFKPKLLLSGSRDDFTPSHQFLEFCQALPEPREYELIEGADHFWWGYEFEVGVKVSAFLSRVMK
jgi:hypothetical protein